MYNAGYNTCIRHCISIGTYICVLYVTARCKIIIIIIIIKCEKPFAAVFTMRRRFWPGLQPLPKALHRDDDEGLAFETLAPWEHAEHGTHYYHPPTEWLCAERLLFSCPHTVVVLKCPWTAHRHLLLLPRRRAKRLQVLVCAEPFPRRLADAAVIHTVSIILLVYRPQCTARWCVVQRNAYL